MTVLKGRYLDAGRRTCATFGPGEVRPQCEDPHIGPHNGCSHPTAPSRGYRPCAADGACPIRLPDAYPGRFCPEHEDLAWTLPEHERDAELATITKLMRGRGTCSGR